MFDLQPPRHISTLRFFRVAVHPGEGLLTERTADARACRYEPVLMPHTSHSSPTVVGLSSRRGKPSFVSGRESPGLGQSQRLGNLRGHVGEVRWTQRFINEFRPALVFARYCS